MNAYLWLLDNQTASDTITIAGESSGGGLAMSRLFGGAAHTARQAAHGVASAEKEHSRLVSREAAWADLPATLVWATRRL